MRARKWSGSIIIQVAALFLAGILITGMMTYFTEQSLSSQYVLEQTEQDAAEVADEVMRSVKEYPAWEWLIRYWYTHADTMEIHYDELFTAESATAEMSRVLIEHQPELSLVYATTEELTAMPEADQKLYAEIVYSWLITRLDQIKQAYHIDYLFCVVTQAPYDQQFFLFSGADSGAVRGTNYEEVYPIGHVVTVGESQQIAMQRAMENASHMADAGSYMDYYSLFYEFDDHAALLGMTYNLSDMQQSMREMTAKDTLYAILNQIALSLICLTLLYFVLLRPLKDVQKNIRLYHSEKDSRAVVHNLERVRPHNEIGQLSEDVSALATEMDDYMNRIERISAERERVKTELHTATQIQASMLPCIFPPFPERTEFDIYASMDPAREVGGDFYDFFLIDDDHLCMVMADVSGKGVPAALFMMVSKIILSNNAKMGKSPAQILTDTNSAICQNNREEMFVTVWIGILELSTGKLTAANAGHEYPVLMQPDGQFELMHDKHGFVIGGMEGMKYKEYELTLRPGTKLFVYTDGVPEATNADKELFGTERMLAALNQDTAADPETALRNVRRAVDDFVQEAEQFDDLTMLCMEYRKPETQTKI
ncbi:MAG: serine/threonine-protein phosphatase [Oscillospiraceae bacterium]|nr:serine/threonine-protein phosphatase [Oscillospiraceae bacterium]